MAITITEAVVTTSTLNVTSYTSGAFTPAANDQLIVFVTAASTIVTGTMTDSQALGFTKIASTTLDGATHIISCFIANNLAAASSMTVTFDCTGDAAQGCMIAVYRVAGAATPGGTYVQVKAAFNDTVGVPTVVMDSSFSTGNTGLGAVAQSANPAGFTPRTSPVWTEIEDNGFATPDHGMEVMYIITGETSNTIAWGNSSGGGWGAIVVEFAPATGGGGGGSTVSSVHKMLLGDK